MRTCDSDSSQLRGRVLAVNGVGVSASAVIAAVGLVLPDYVQPGSAASPVGTFWAASSATRTWAITGPLLVGLARGGRPAPQLLLAAGVVQLLDAGLGVWQRKPAIAVLPVIMGVIHLASVRTLTVAPAG